MKISNNNKCVYSARQTTMPNSITSFCNTWFVTMVLNIWWRHQMEKKSALLALCARNSPVTGEFPSQRPVTQSFDVFFDLRLNKRFSKQSWGWWFDMPSRSLWCHCNEINENVDLFSGQKYANAHSRLHAGHLYNIPVGTIFFIKQFLVHLLYIFTDVRWSIFSPNMIPKSL